LFVGGHDKTGLTIHVEVTFTGADVIQWCLENEENLITTAEKEFRYYNLLSRNIIQLYMHINETEKA